MMVLASRLLAISPPNGVVPILVPAGGFAIDGNLLANNPANGVGDWITNAIGSGGGVLNSNGIPFNGVTTFHLVDPYSSPNDSIITGGNADGDPNGWTWGIGTVLNKEDMNNGLLHVGLDASNHVWIIISADHTGTGDADMHLFFLQNAFTKNANGTFTSTGAHGGLTINDLRMKLNFSGDTLTMDRWETNIAGGYQWVDATASLPNGFVYMAVSPGNNTYVPYGAFGSTNYPTADFVETAADFTRILGNIDACATAGFHEVFAVTLHPSGSLSDFIDPIAVNVTVGLNAQAGPNLTNCYQGAITTFSVQGSAGISAIPILSTNWTVVSGGATILSPHSVNTTVQVPSLPAGTNVTLRLSLTTACSTKTDDVVLTVAPMLPPCSLTGPAMVCPASTNQYSGPAGLSTYAWTVTGNGTITGPTNQQTVKLVSGSACGQNFALKLVSANANLCSQVCSNSVSVNNTNPPSITCPTNLTVTSFSQVPAPNPASVTATDDCGTPVKSFVSDTSVTNGPIVTITRTYAATDSCSNVATCAQTITVNTSTPTTATALTNVVLCPGQSASFTTVAGGTGPYTYVWRKDGVLQGSTSNKLTINSVSATNAGTYTVVVTGYVNSVTNSATLVVNTNTSATALTNLVVCSGQSAGFITVASGTGPFSYVWRKSGTLLGSTSNRLVLSAVASSNAGTYSVEVNGLCTSVTNTATLGVNENVKIVTPPANATNCVGEPVTFSVAATGTGLAFQWTFNGNVLSTSNSLMLSQVQLTNAGNYTVIVSGICGGPVTNVASLTVNPLPAITCSTNKTVELGTAWTFNTPTANYPITIVGTTTNAACGNTFSAIRTWKATDACGNTNACSQTVTVVDTTPPAIVCPSNLSLTADAGQCSRSNVTFEAGATDNSTVTNLVSTPPSGSAFPVGTTTVHIVATDACGNSNTCQFTVTVTDNEAPTIICPTNVTVSANSGCTATNVQLGTPFTGDNCGATFVTNDAPASFSLGTNLVTWLVTDSHSNTNRCTQQVIVVDSDAPTITCPSNLVLTADAGRCSRSNVTFIVGSTDNCSVASMVSVPASGSTFPVGVTTVTNTATDGTGNQTVCTFTVTITDDEVPSITCPSNVIVAANSGCTATNVSLGAPTISDNCGMTSVTNDAPASFTFGTNIVTWLVIDSHGNSNRCSQLVIVIDTNAPVITCPSNLVLTADAGQCTRSNVTFVAGAIDNCSVSNVVSVPASGSTFLVGTTTVTNNATDGSGNQTVCTFTVTITDDEAPTILCPTNITVSANSGCNATNVTLGTPVTSDNCGATSVTNDAPTSFSLGTNIVTWTVTDSHGNTNRCLQQVIVLDTTAPTIICPSNLTVSANSNCTATNVSLGTPATDDNCRVALVTNDAPTSFSLGTNVVTWTVTDGSGNTNTCSQLVIVRDTTPPTIVCPADVTVSANSGCYATNLTLGGPDYADNCSVASVVSSLPVAHLDPLAWWTADSGTTDRMGNVPAGVLTNGAVIVPGGEVGNAFYFNGPNPSVSLGDPAILAITNSFTIESWVKITGLPGASQFNQGQILFRGDHRSFLDPYELAALNTGGIRLHVENAAGQIANLDTAPVPFNQWIHVAGVFNSTNGNMRVYVNGQLFAQMTTAIRPFANLDKANLGGVGIGNTGNGDILEPFNGYIDEVAIYNYTLTDAQIQGIFAAGTAGKCGTPAPPSVCPVGSYIFPVGTNIVTWTVTDGSGNTNGCTQRVIVKDTTSPTITCPLDVTVSVNSGCTATNVTLSAPTFSDNCGVGSVISNAPPIYTLGTNLVTWTATDGSGNTNTCIQRVIVRDTTPPSIACPSNVTVSANSGCTATNVALGTPAFGDNCTVGSVTNNAPSSYNLGTNTVTWIITDGSGNTNTCTQLVIVKDTTPPTLTCPADVTVSANFGCNATNVTLGMPVYGDNCGVASVVNSVMVSNLNPVAWWPGESNAIDIVSGLNGTLSNGVTFAAGEAGQAFNFNGANQVIITNNARMNVRSNLTLETWVYPTTRTGSLNMILDKEADDGSVGQYGISIKALPTGDCPSTVTSGNLMFFLLGLSGVPSDYCGWVDTGAVVPLNQWSHVAVIYDGASVTAYINGVAVRKVTGVSGVVNTSSGAFHIGSRSAPVLNASTDNRQFIGLIDEPALFDRALTMAQIQAIVTAGAAGKCGTPTPPSVCPSSSYLYPLGTNFVAWTITDSSGNTNTCTQRVIVKDTTLPTITCPSDVIVSANSGCNATNITLGTPVFGDNCSVASITNNALASYSVGTNFVTWIVKDDSGNTNTCIQRVIVRDTTPPNINCPTNITVNAAVSSCFSNVTFTVTATDNCGSIASLVSTPASGSAFPVGLTTVTNRATDSNGNTNICTFTVRVLDKQPPTIFCPTNLVLATDPGRCSRSNVTFTVTATDTCAGAVTVVSTPASGSTFPVGTTTVTNVATDVSGNTNTCTFTVTVNYSSTGNPQTGLVVLMGIDAEDGGPGGHGPITTWQTFASNVVRQAVGGSGMLVLGGGKSTNDDVTVFWNAIATYCKLPVTFASGSNNIATIPISGYKLICVATTGGTASGPTVVGGLTVAENDALAKRTDDIANFVNSGRAFWGMASSFDPTNGHAGAYAYFAGVGGLGLVDGDYKDIDVTPAGTALGMDDTLDISNWHVSFTNYPVFLKPLALVHNTNSLIAAIGGSVNIPFFTVSCLNAITSPCPASVSLTGQVVNTACQILKVTWKVDGVTVQTNTITPSSASSDVVLIRPYSVGTHTVSYTATDGAASLGCGTTVTVTPDTVKPVITCPTNMVLSADPGQCTRSNVTFNVVATDNCSVTNLVSTPASGSTFPLGTTTVTSIARDAAGNTNVCSFTVTVKDLEKPVIVCPTNMSLTVNPGECTRSNVTYNVMTTDNCSLSNVVTAPASGSAFPVGTTTVSTTAIDASGNSSQCSFTVTVRPDIVTPALTIRLNGGQVQLLWPTNSVGFQVQKTTSLSSPAWTILPGAPVIVGQDYFVVDDSPGSTAFYRLENDLCNSTAPILGIRRVGAQVQVFWLTSAVGFHLQSSATVDVAASWGDVTNTPVSSGQNYEVLMDASASTRFFRLIKP